MALEEKVKQNDNTQAIQKEIIEKERKYRADIEKYKKDLEATSRHQADSKLFQEENAKLKAELERMKRD